jgi:hypothetical protein
MRLTSSPLKDLGLNMLLLRMTVYKEIMEERKVKEKDIWDKSNDIWGLVQL